VSINSIFPIIPFLIIGLVLALLFSKKGKELLFGGRILETLDDSVSVKKWMMTSTLRVHVIDGKPSGEPHRVGLEVASRAALSASMMPLTMSREDALQLAEMLTKAARS